MNDKKTSRRDIVDRFLKTLEGPSASVDQIRVSRERLHRLVEMEWNDRAQERERTREQSVRVVHRSRLWMAVPAGVASVVLLAIFLFRFQPPNVAPGPTAEQSTDTIDLPDGSRIEKSPGTELRVTRGDGGVRIELARGAVIVTAAPQREGHLIVQTKDCEVSVVGTVFAVRVEADGSRVSVFEGKVNVTHAGEGHLLSAGEQYVTNPSLSLVPLAGEIAWSRNAAALLALVTPAQPIPQTTPQVFASGPASIEGHVFIRGTSRPLGDVDLELSRVEGTTLAPLGPGVAEAFDTILFHNRLGFPDTNNATPPAVVAPEVKYGKTDGDGRFKFDGLKEGKYRLAAVRNGGEYYPAEFGQRDLQQRGLYFPVVAGEALKDLKIEMTPTGAITGRVIDEDGLPLGHLVVMALTAQYRGGDKQYFIERQAMTDENGAYRLYWLGPGKYYVAAVYEDERRRQTPMAPTAPPGRTLARSRATSPVVLRQVFPDGSVVEEAYGVVYYGGTTDPVAAAEVEVRPGETFGGADIPMGAGKMRTGHIHGIVINGETGQPARGATVIATPRQWRPNAAVLFGTTDRDGAFDLAGALPDGYFLTASVSGSNPPGGATTAAGTGGVTTLPQARPQVGFMSLDTDDRQGVNVRIVTTPGITLSGRVTLQGGSAAESATALSRMTVGLTRDPDLLAMSDPFMPIPQSATTPRNGQVVASGDFTMFVAPGDFRMNVANVPAGMYVKSITMGSEDILRSGLHVTKSVESPVQIVVSSDGGTISGRVLDGAMRPFSNATVALVPDAPDLRRRSDLYRNATSDASGNFILKAIPPGSYKLFAWDWAPPDSWQNADFIRAYEGQAKSIQISPFEKQERVQVNVINKAR